MNPRLWFSLVLLLVAHSSATKEEYLDDDDDSDSLLPGYRPVIAIEASTKTEHKIEKPRFAFGAGGFDILGAMVQPLLMMLGMASFVSMMPSVAQNVGNMIPNLFPFVGSGGAAAAPAAAPAASGKRRRRSAEEPVLLTPKLLELWARVAKALDEQPKE